MKIDTYIVPFFRKQSSSGKLLPTKQVASIQSRLYNLRAAPKLYGMQLLPYDKLNEIRVHSLSTAKYYFIYPT